MTKFSVLPLLFLLNMMLTGCMSYESKSSLPIEMIAFNSLTKEEQNSIPVSPKDSTVEKINVDEKNRLLFHKDYNKEQVYSVTFNNLENADKLQVFIDLDKETVIGKVFLTK
ncbi:PBP1b-binding outer membrane lipoprotein LpoB [Metabacillus crassostreae]|uniref:hypothetical protein n=1 Tax=Metabacillus crassostreae TaxID=929098 RepID=UPI001959820A|nr:hypothetical protein [Metabacillus crassostreae]MBM7602887.1 PBP1b-binding outer membrane lipoprotein LpoB [Metabacillus crassostreae]